MSIPKSLSNSITLVLACIGCFVALVLFVEHLKPEANIGCAAVGGDCKAAQNSAYGSVGKIPTSLFGVGMYLTLAGLCLKRRKLLADARLRAQTELHNEATGTDDDPDALADTTQPYPMSFRPEPPPSPLNISRWDTLRWLDALVWIIAASAVGISWWLQDMALFVIVSFCPWCMTSAFLVTCIFVLASSDLFLEGQPLVGEQKLLVGTVTLIAALGLIMLVPDILAQIRIAGYKAAAMMPRVIYVKPDQLPIVTKDMETQGAKSAPFLLVEFADYQCPHCARTSRMLDEELKKYPTKYRLAFRNYPLNVHKWATQAAVAAEAAGEQGKFWEMHDYIFEHQKALDDPQFTMGRFVEYARAIGLNTATFEKDAESEKIISRVANDSATARQLDIKMTPTIFVLNGKGRVFQITGMDDMKLAMEHPDNKAWQDDNTKTDKP